jgi:glycosyltransferase involved in cell wall biosynthesis
MIPQVKFVILEDHNFIDYPIGGSLSFDLQLLRVCPNVALAGITTSSQDPIGQWFIKSMHGSSYWFFAFRKVNRTSSKPFIPSRLTNWASIKRHWKALYSGIPCKNIFTQSPQIVLAIKSNQKMNLCFCFAGTENSVALSRYPYLRKFSKYYEKKLFESLKTKASCIFASADNNAVNAMCNRSNGILSRDSVKLLPTRFDDKIFYPKDKSILRRKLGIEDNIIQFIFCGRLSWVKGVDFIIESFRIFQKTTVNSQLVIIGDGEERENLEKQVNLYGLNEKIHFLGRQEPQLISDFLNSSDGLLVASLFEGWSVTMMEALACGLSIISTNVSGAQDMIIHGRNGFLLYDRSIEDMAKYMYEIVRLDHARETSLSISKRYSLSSLKKHLFDDWVIE